MRPIVSIFLLLLMIGSGTGLFQRLHMLQHEHENAVIAANAPAAEKSHPSFPHKHSEDDCPICAQFHAPIISMPTVAWLIDTGVWVRYVSMLAVSQQSQTVPERISCRGPPSLLFC